MKASELLKVGDMVRVEGKNRGFSIRCSIADIKDKTLTLLPKSDEDPQDLEVQKRILVALWNDRRILPVTLYFLLHRRRHVCDSYILECREGENGLMVDADVDENAVESERRSDFRVSLLPEQIQVRVISGVFATQGVIKDLSGRGINCRIERNEVFPAIALPEFNQKPCYTVFSLPNIEEPFKLIGKVIGVHLQKGVCVDMGIEFTDLRERDKAAIGIYLLEQERIKRGNCNL